MRNNVKLRLTRSRSSCFALHCYTSSYSASWLRRFLSYAQCVNILQTSCDANQHHFADHTKLAAHSLINHYCFQGNFDVFAVAMRRIVLHKVCSRHACRCLCIDAAGLLKRVKISFRNLSFGPFVLAVGGRTKCF